MTRTTLGSLTAFVLLALAGCGSPCKAHDGTVDGYCEGTVAMNCRQTCADCIDSWEMQACPVACSVAAAKPSEGGLPFSDPAMSQPAKWAVCAP
ncbi:MAG TPA: hypothetical protein VGK67_30900 [Myxococcales bacterium]